MLTKFLILVVVCNSAASQLLLKRAVNDIGAPSSYPGLLQFFVAAAGSPPVWISLVLQVLGYALWIVVLTQEKVGVAVAMLGSGFYLLMAVLAWVFFDERLGPVQWAGIVLITVGVACLLPRPA
jgi:drug/metabolite transporter (DMT)-like permease